MESDCSTSPLSSISSISSSLPQVDPQPPQSPAHNTSSRRGSPLSDAEKLDKVFECLRTSVYWSISDFIRALTVAKGAVNARRKAAFAAAAYKEPKVLESYFVDEGIRQSVTQALDLDSNELRKEVRKLNDIETFTKFSSNTGDERSYDMSDMGQVIDNVEKKAPLLLKILQDIMAPELRRLYQRQNEPVGRLVAILSILCFSQRQNTSTGLQTLLGLYFHSKGVGRRQIEVLSKLGLTQLVASRSPYH